MSDLTPTPADFQPGEILEITLVARFAEYVADGAAIVVNHEYRTNADTSTTYVSETSIRLGHNLTIIRRAPDVQIGDLWRDRENDLWFAIASDDDKSVEMVCTTGASPSDPAYIAKSYGPLTLVHREVTP